MKSHQVPFRQYFLLHINFVIRMLILSDVIWGGAVGLLGPIFAIFIVDFIEGGNAAVAGVAMAIYLVVKSVMQIPAASIIDKIRGEKDDFWILFVGSLLGALMPLLYLVISTPTQLYVVEALYGLVIAFTFPSYMVIYTRHIDKEKEATSWGIYFTLNDFSAAIAASIGGIVAELIGFKPLIVGVVILSVLGVLLIFPIRPYMRMPKI
jgi:MFS family permease